MYLKVSSYHYGKESRLLEYFNNLYAEIQIDHWNSQSSKLSLISRNYNPENTDHDQ